MRVQGGRKRKGNTEYRNMTAEGYKYRNMTVQGYKKGIKVRNTEI